MYSVVVVELLHTHTYTHTKSRDYMLFWNTDSAKDLLWNTHNIPRASLQTAKQATVHTSRDVWFRTTEIAHRQAWILIISLRYKQKKKQIGIYNYTGCVLRQSNVNSFITERSGQCFILDNIIPFHFLLKNWKLCLPDSPCIWPCQEDMICSIIWSSCSRH